MSRARERAIGSRRRSAAARVVLAALVPLLAACGDDDQGPAPPEPPVAPPEIRLNELMADNTVTLHDERGDYDDWIELVNDGAETVSTSGLYLTDDLATRNRWALPDTTLDAGDVLLLWADGEPVEGKWHVSFRLSAAGEELGLFHGTALALVDTTTFGPQRPDTSLARTGAGWALDPTPTPGRPND